MADKFAPIYQTNKNPEPVRGKNKSKRSTQNKSSKSNISKKKQSVSSRASKASKISKNSKSKNSKNAPSEVPCSIRFFRERQILRKPQMKKIR